MRTIFGSAHQVCWGIFPASWNTISAADTPLHIDTPWDKPMPDIRELFESMEYGPAPEDAAAARQWISDHDSLFGHWINGDWTEATSYFDSVNPASI